MKLTQIAHQIVRQHIPEGGIAVDATAGNGYDTSFLARCVGETGHVYAFDIQRRAIAATEHRLASRQLLDRVSLICDSHVNLPLQIDEAAHGRVNAIVFNLGYLPGGDKTLTTKAETTLTAIASAIGLLSDNGVLSLMAYRGHAGGISEFSAVSNWVNEQSATHALLDHQESPNGGPAWWLLAP
ncbi:MAG: class I SAM-dependent methyltransferase [Pseudomonadota bacterium]